MAEGGGCQQALESEWEASDRTFPSFETESKMRCGTTLKS